MYDTHLVREVVRLVVEDALDGDDVRRVRRLIADAAHDSDQHLRMDLRGRE
jgi:hypothetical protein